MDRIHRDILRCVLPFATWLGLQSLLPSEAWAYAVRTVATAAVGIACLKGAETRGGLGWRGAALGAALGIAVCALWIAPESSAWYRAHLCWPAAPEPKTSPYDPASCGWTLTCLKLFGSAFVIAPVEEVFFRSFLYRWLQRRDFTSVPLSRFDLSAFLWTVLLFTLEHDRPAVAALAGALYGFAAIRLGLGAAIVAHMVTNLALGLYVIRCDAWGFW